MSKLKLTGGGRFRLSGSGRFILASDVSAGRSPATLTLVDIWTGYAGAQPILQRFQEEAYGNLPVMITYTGPDPTAVQARVVKAVGGAVVVDWTLLTSQWATGGVGAGMLNNIPLGDGYRLQVRDSLQPTNSATISNGATVWGVGCKTLFFGQSNMLNTLNTSYTSVAPVTGSPTEYAYWASHPVHGSVIDDAGTHGPTAGAYGAAGSINSALGNICAFMRIMADGLKAKYGYDVPVGIIPWAFSNQGIQTFQNGGSHWNLFTNSGTSASTRTIGFMSPKNYLMGDFEQAFYHQGEADNGQTAAWYQGQMQTLNNDILTHLSQFGRPAANFHFCPAVLGNYGVGNCPAIENIRNGVRAFEVWAAANARPKSRIGWTTIDLDTAANGGAGLHFYATSDQQKSMRRCIQTALFNAGASSLGPSGQPFSGRGPDLNTTPTRAGNIVTFSVIHEGGNALTVAAPASPPTGFYVNTLSDFTGTDIAVTVALVNGNTQIQLTLPGGTVYPVYAKHMGGKVGSTVVDVSGHTASCNPDWTNMVRDNVSYPSHAVGTDVEALGLPLLPSYGAITIN